MCVCADWRILKKKKTDWKRCSYFISSELNAINRLVGQKSNNSIWMKPNGGDGSVRLYRQANASWAESQSTFNPPANTNKLFSVQSHKNNSFLCFKPWAHRSPLVWARSRTENPCWDLWLWWKLGAITSNPFRVRTCFVCRKKKMFNTQ